MPSGRGDGPTDADAVAEFTRLLATSRLHRVYAETTSTGSSQGSDRYDFCADGTFSYYGEYIGFTGNAYVTEYRGTWQVQVAAFSPDRSAIEALIAYTTDSTETPPGPQGQLVMRLVGDHQVFVAGDPTSPMEFQRMHGGAEC